MDADAQSQHCFPSDSNSQDDNSVEYILVDEVLDVLQNCISECNVLTYTLDDLRLPVVLVSCMILFLTVITWGIEVSWMTEILNMQ